VDELAVVAAEVRACTKCPLATTRTRAVPGEGPADAEIMFVGEGPGYHEDRRGRPFVGPSGALLDELLGGIGLRREQVFITNVVKCRPTPPDNRDPAPDEIAACAPYLERQIALIDPAVIVPLGRFSLARFLPGQSISKARGRPVRQGKRIIYPMFHPAFALRREDMMATMRADMARIPALVEEARRAPEPGAEEESPDDDSPQQLALFSVD
jgi:uracil-DNA glycosylase family 4